LCCLLYVKQLVGMRLEFCSQLLVPKLQVFHGEGTKSVAVMNRGH